MINEENNANKLKVSLIANKQSSNSLIQNKGKVKEEDKENLKIELETVIQNRRKSRLSMEEMVKLLESTKYNQVYISYNILVKEKIT